MTYYYTAPKIDTTLANCYHYLYYYHQALNNYHQVLRYIKYLKLQFSITTIVVLVANKII